MGLDYAGQEKGIEDLKKMSDEARTYLSHHIRNELTVIIHSKDDKQGADAVAAAWHILEDLQRIGC